MTGHSPQNRTILFAPAAGPRIGGGHAMRCLTLAEALAERGACCAFVVNDVGEALLKTFGRDAFAIHRVKLEAAIDLDTVHTLVIDDYAVGADQEHPLSRRVQKLVVIDDLANRRHAADLLIDPSFGRMIEDYDGLLPDTVRRLVGPTYALVNPMFSRLRPVYLAKPVRAAPQHLFMSFGLSDVGGIAGRATAVVRSRFPDIEIDLALSAGTESAAVLQARTKTDAALHLHFDAANVADLMAAADLAIGAGGASTWERCCLGVPTLAVIVADNQRHTIQRLASDGTLWAVELGSPTFEADFLAALEVLQAPEVRQDLRRRSSTLCDGLGAQRVADAILSL